MRIHTVKVILLWLFVFLFVSGCKESNNENPTVMTLADVELCLEQGGEWAYECVYQGETCLIYTRCKQNAVYCPCDVWVRND